MDGRLLITGSNRGIGLEFTRQYLQAGWDVISTCRTPSEADQLKDLSNRYDERSEIIKLDVTEPDQVTATFEAISERWDGLDLLINNAGIYGKDSDFRALEAEDLLEPFEVNCMGTFRVTKKFLPLLNKSDGDVVALTSLMGSIEDNRSGGSYPYRISKAALNMLSKTFAEDFRSKNVNSAILHPGWVKTDMGGPNAKISVEESVSGMRDVISKLDSERSGEFYAYDGEKRPW